MRSWDRVAQWNPVDEWEGGFGWSQDEFMRRSSRALLVDGRVWLIDPVDTPELEERVRALGAPAGVLQLLDRHERGCAAWAQRLGVPHLRAWESVGAAPFEALPVRRRRWWHEVALTSVRPENASACTRSCARSRRGPLDAWRRSGSSVGTAPACTTLRPQRCRTRCTPQDGECPRPGSARSRRRLGLGVRAESAA